MDFPYKIKKKKDLWESVNFLKLKKNCGHEYNHIFPYKWYTFISSGILLSQEVLYIEEAENAHTNSQ